MKKIADIDIDFADREKALEFIDHIAAAMISNKEIKNHIVGVYPHNVPVDPVTNICSIDYKQAENYGFFKIDFLNVSIYKSVKNSDHLDELIEREPVWDLLEAEDVVDSLFHINGHFDIVSKMKPKSVEQLAMVLAMIRPAKRYLVGKPWDEVEKEIWTKPTDDSYFFKKSHSFSYAFVIIVQMNLLVEEIMENA